jgi:anti-sigma factor RsiW
MGDEIRTCRDVEERLTPYVDGEAAAQARQAIDAHLSACPPCRHAADAERGGRELIHGHRDALRTAAPSALRARCAAHAGAARGSSIRRWFPLSLAATLVLAAAGAVTFSISHPADALAASFALDHMKCFRIGDTTHPIDPAAAEVAWRQDHGWVIDVPSDDPTCPIQLVSVRRCLSADGLAAHLMYRWRGEPVSVYVLPRREASNAVVDSLGYETAIWNNDGRTYALVVPGHPNEFPQLVQYVKAHAH